MADQKLSALSAAPATPLLDTDLLYIARPGSSTQYKGALSRLFGVGGAFWAEYLNGTIQEALAGTAGAFVGTLAVANTGSLTTGGDPTSGYAFGAYPMLNHQTTTSANSVIRVEGSALTQGLCASTSFSGMGGFGFEWIGGWGTFNNGHRLFVGMHSQTSGQMAATTEPSAFTNLVGLGKDSGDTNLQFMVNDGSGSATKTDLGVTGVTLASCLLRFRLFCQPGSTDIYYELYNCETQSVLASGTATTNLPAQNHNLVPRIQRSVVSTAALGTLYHHRIRVARRSM